MGVSAVRTVSGAIDIRSSNRDYFLDPLVILAASLSIAGLAIVTARRQLLLPLVACSYVGLLLIFNSKYEVIPNSRFSCHSHHWP